jgi:hydroxyquinol 1,2-dioxygenase
VFGPFFVEGSPAFENDDDLGGGGSDQPCYMSGTVKDLGGKPAMR